MTSSTRRIAASLGISRTAASRATRAWVIVVALFTAVVIVRGGLLQAVVLSTAFLILLVSFKWPSLPLYAFAFLIPIEELLVFGSYGTLSRYFGILFVVAYGLPRLGTLRVSVMPAAAWAYVGWAIVSVVWALDPMVATSELATLLPLFLVSTLIAVIVAERPGIVRPLLWTYSSSATLTAIVGISIFLAGGGAGGDRVAALPGQDPAHYAALLLPSLAFSLHELVSGRTRSLSAAVAFLCFVGIVVSGTRGAWVSATIVILLFIVPRITPIQRVASVAALAVVLAIGLQVPAVAALAERADTAISSGGAGRTDIWRVGITIIGAAPVTGVGFANFPVAYSPEAVRASDVGEYASRHQALVDLGLKRSASSNAHSIIIGTLGELGIVGLILLASFLLPLLLKAGWGPDAQGVQAALVALAISALFLDVLNRKQVWLIIGIACGLAFLAHVRRAQDPRANRRPRRGQGSGEGAKLDTEMAT